MVLESHVKLCVIEWDFLGKFFLPPKLGRPKMGQKQGFFNFLENLVINFYWILSIMKIYIICCVPAKFLLRRYGPKCSQPIRLQDSLINHISRKINEIAWFFTCWHKFRWIIWVWPAWSQDSKIDCISRISWWSELIFCMES